MKKTPCMIEHLAVFRFGSWMPKDLAPGPAGRLFALLCTECCLLFTLHCEQKTVDSEQVTGCTVYCVDSLQLCVCAHYCVQCSLNPCFGC